MHRTGLHYQQFLIVAACMFCGWLVAAPGDLDSGFGNGGKVTSAVGEGGDFGRGVALQADGKLVVAGYAHNGTNYDFAVVRYNADGSLDPSFDSDGKVITPVGTGDDFGLGVAIQPDGKIVVAGYTGNGASADIAVVRHNTDGSLDSDFDGDGKVVTPVGPAEDMAWSIAMQNDGKLVVGGRSSNGTLTEFVVVRYTATGLPDDTFGGSGKVSTPVGTGNAHGRGIAIQPDGKIMLAGQALSGSDNDYAAVRYNTDGTLDLSFDGDGKSLIPVGTATDYAYSVSLQADKIIIGGYSYEGTNANFALVRLTHTGLLDNSFGTNGKVITPIGAGDDFGLITAVQPDQKILMAGSSMTTGTTDFAVVRYGVNGALDTLFGEQGKVTTPIGTGSDASWSMALQTDGKIVAAGHTNNGSNYDIAIVRYEGLTNQENWRRIHFGSSANSGNGSDLNDYDKDGITNLAEYAFGLNPKLSSSAQLPTAVISADSLTFSFNQPEGVAGVSYGAEWTTSLLPGDWHPVADTGTPPYHIFSVAIGSNPRLYMRLIVTSP